MNIIRKIVVGIAGLFVVALALELAAPKAVHALVSTLVTVANTSSNPLPTMAVDTRNVNVINTPNVAATINGTPTVNIGSMPAVAIGGSVNATVTNATDTKGNPVLVTESDEARNSFYISQQCLFAGSICQLQNVLSVPANEIAVIQSLSGTCIVGAGTALAGIEALWIGPGGTAQAFVPPGPATPFGGGLNYVFGQNLQLYVTGATNAAAQVSISAAASGPPPTG